MTVEQVEQQPTQEVTEEQQALHEAAAFAEAFAKTRGEEPPQEAAPEPQAAPEQPEEPTKAIAEPPPAEGASEEGHYVIPGLGLTEGELKAAILKANEVDSVKAHIEKAFGKIGEVFRKQQALEQRNQATPSGGQVKLTSESFKRMHTQWPEMAADLAQDLSEALANVGGSAAAAAFDPSEIERIVAVRVSETEKNLNQSVERRLLSRSHPDWEGVVTSPDFSLWKQNVLKEEERATLNASWDADFIGKKIDEFRSWKDKSQQSRTNKQKRLEAAIQPTGGAVPTSKLSEDDAFHAGFKLARGLR